MVKPETGANLTREGLGGREHVVLLVHGIRTQAEWAHKAAAIIEKSDPTIRVRPIKYEFFDSLRFVLPFRRFRQRPITRVTRQIDDELSKRPKKISVVAHSFGTFIVAQILEQEPHISLHRLVLCGSIIPNDFQWERYKHRINPEAEASWQVINDCGMKDLWPVLAQSLTWGYGSSGRFGFGHGRVKDRFFNVGHSEFFQHAFIQEYWVPYLSLGEIREGELQIPTTPWWVSMLTVLKLRWVMLAVGMVLVGAMAWPFLPTIQTAPQSQGAAVLQRPPEVQLVQEKLGEGKVIQEGSEKGRVLQEQSFGLRSGSCADPGNTDRQGFTNKGCTWLSTHIVPKEKGSQIEIDLKLQADLTQIGCGDPHRRAEVFLKIGESHEVRSGQLGVDNRDRAVQDYRLSGTFNPINKERFLVEVVINPRGCTQASLISGELEFTELRK